MKRSNRQALGSWEFGAELTYKLTSWFKVGAEGVWMERRELGGVFHFKPNGSLGLQFDIDTDYISKQGKNGGSRFTDTKKEEKTLTLK